MDPYLDHFVPYFVEKEFFIIEITYKNCIGEHEKL